MTKRSGAAAMGILMCATLAACAAATPVPDRDALSRTVEDTERAFAATMARRDHAAFVSFLSEEAVFFSNSGPLRGRQAVADAWKPYYEKAEPPFSWAPERVEVLDSGTLALSTGAVRDPAGKPIGTFTSVWRLEAPGTWRIVFDKGCPVCERCPNDGGEDR